MKAPGFRISPRVRAELEPAFEEVCEHRGWAILALNIRFEHIHVVVAAQDQPEKVLGAFKAYGTRRLRELGLVDADARVWARHGSTRLLTTESAVFAAIDYTANRQGMDLPGAGALHRLGKD